MKTFSRLSREIREYEKEVNKIKRERERERERKENLFKDVTLNRSTVACQRQHLQLPDPLHVFHTKAEGHAHYIVKASDPHHEHVADVCGKVCPRSNKRINR
jgi:hypothetical protein